MRIVLVIIYLVLTILGVILIKLGGTNVSPDISITKMALNVNISMITILGMLCYILSFLFYTVLLSKYDLSYIVPITTGLVYILSMIASIFIFKEVVTINQLVGSLVILAGIIVGNLKG